MARCSQQGPNPQDLSYFLFMPRTAKPVGRWEGDNHCLLCSLAQAFWESLLWTFKLLSSFPQITFLLYFSLPGQAREWADKSLGLCQDDIWKWQPLKGFRIIHLGVSKSTSSINQPIKILFSRRLNSHTTTTMNEALQESACMCVSMFFYNIHCSTAIFLRTALGLPRRALPTCVWLQIT